MRPPYGAFARTPATPPLHITDTQHLNLPINCVVIGQQDYEVEETVIDSHKMNIKTRVTLSSGGTLQGGKTSFTVTTNKKGYD
jgi:hypothetical protein